MTNDNRNVKYAIRKVSLLSIIQFGLVVGTLASLVPSLLCGLLSLPAASALRGFIESWKKIEFKVLEWQFSFDPVEFLGLSSLLELLRGLERSWWMVPLAALGTSIVLGLFLALIAALAGWGYNIVARIWGGLILEAEEMERYAVPVPQAVPSPAAPPLASAPRTVPSPAAPPAAPAPQAADAWLIQTGEAGESFPTLKEVTTIGREPGNDLVIESPAVSGRHAEIRRQGERYILFDLGSANGTLVNGRLIKENMLKEGFVVRFGDVEFVFRRS